MGILTHKVTYQGKEAKRCMFRRSEGLSPEYGYVDLNLEDFKKISIEMDDVPWRGVNGFVWPGPVSLKIWKDQKSEQSVSTPKGRVPKAAGFAPYGDLVLQSFDEGKPLSESQVFRDIYISESGIEELEVRRADILSHDKGTVRVHLTDIRQFYSKHGYLLSSVNVRLKGGGFDGQTIENPKKGEPWKIIDILPWLFSQLPGTPLIDSGCEFWKIAKDIEPPSDILGDGESVVSRISQVLFHYGLVARMLPDGNYIVEKVGTAPFSHGNFAVEVNKSGTGKYLHEERKTFYVTNRSAAISVLGKRRIRRTFLSYVPIFQNPEDGCYHMLENVDIVFSYPLEKVKKQVFTGHEKNFLDVPPLGTRTGWLRSQALRAQAYKWYAPARYFAEDEAINQIPMGFTDAEIKKFEFVPFQDVPLYESEIGVYKRKYSTDTKGDRGPFSLNPPFVWAYRVGQGFFNDFSEVASYYGLLKRNAVETLNQLKEDASDIRRKIQDKGNILRNANMYLDQAFDSAKAMKMLSKFKEITLGLDETLIAGLTKILLHKEKLEGMEALNKALTSDYVRELETELAEVMRRQAEQQEIINKWDAVYERQKRVLEKIGGIQAKVNLPYGVCEQGSYEIDERTGIIKFAEHACGMDKPFVFDGDAAEAIADGAVSVMSAYELNGNVPEDWTSVLFVVEQGYAEPEVACAGINCPSAITPLALESPKMRLYEDENGIAMNATQCIVEAAGRAFEAINFTKGSTGYAYTFSGLLKAVPDSGVQSIQYSYDGTKMAGEEADAHTFIAVNYPNAQGPLGRPRLVGLPDDQGARLTDRIHRKMLGYGD